MRRLLPPLESVPALSVWESFPLGQSWLMFPMKSTLTNIPPFAEWDPDGLKLNVSCSPKNSNWAVGVVVSDPPLL